MGYLVNDACQKQEEQDGNQHNAEGVVVQARQGLTSIQKND